MNSKHGEIVTKFGLKVKMERMKRNLSQEELAHLANLNKNSIGAIERGEHVASLKTIDMIAKALGMEITEIVDVNKVDL